MICKKTHTCERNCTSFCSPLIPLIFPHISSPHLVKFAFSFLFSLFLSLLFDQGSEPERRTSLTEIYLVMKIPNAYLLILVIGLTSRTGVMAAPTLQSSGSNILPAPIKLLRVVRSPVPVPFDEENQPELLNFDDMRMIQRLASIVPYIKFSDKRSGKQFRSESNKWFCFSWFLKRTIEPWWLSAHSKAIKRLMMSFLYPQLMWPHHVNRLDA